jgi:hypothetical protein
LQSGGPEALFEKAGAAWGVAVGIRGGPYIFVSHASADNALLKPVVEELARQGIPIWIDKPYHPDLNLDEALFAGCIERAVAEQVEAQRQIALAIRSSHGVLVFPSPSAKASEQVNNEIGRAQEIQDARGSLFGLTCCFLKADWHNFAEWRASSFNGYHTLVEELQPNEFALTARGVGEVQKLVLRLRAHLEGATADSVRKLRFGSFDPTDADILAEEQIDALLTMLDRETAVDELVEGAGLRVLQGHADDRPRHLSMRLPLIELPIRTSRTELSAAAGHHGLVELRAFLVGGGHAGGSSTRWNLKPLAWTDDGKKSFADAYRDLARRLAVSIGCSGLDADAFVSPGRLGEAVLDRLETSADTGQVQRVLMWTEFLDVPALRKRNEALIQRLHEEFMRVDPSNFRAVLLVAPSDAAGRQTDNWLAKQHEAIGVSHRQVRLDRIARAHLLEWEHLVSKLVKTPTAQICAHLDTVFAAKAVENRLSIADLEADLRLAMQTWIRRSQAAEPNLLASRVWADDHV